MVPGALARWVSRGATQVFEVWTLERRQGSELRSGARLVSWPDKVSFQCCADYRGKLHGEAMVLWLEVRFVTGVVRAWNA